MVEAIFGDVPVFLIGAFAAAAYAPERSTKVVDYFVAAERYEDAQARLRTGEWEKTRTLTSPTPRSASTAARGSRASAARRST